MSQLRRLVHGSTASLDAQSRAVVVEMIHEKKKQGVALLGIFHDEDVRHQVADRIVDAVGSGDALLAYAALALYSAKSDVIASVLGSISAAVECQHEGNIPVSPQDVLDKLERVERFINYA